jgi:hypothetical protein
VGYGDLLPFFSLNASDHLPAALVVGQRQAVRINDHRHESIQRDVRMCNYESNQERHQQQREE